MPFLNFCFLFLVGAPALRIKCGADLKAAGYMSGPSLCHGPLAVPALRPASPLLEIIEQYLVLT